MKGGMKKVEAIIAPFALETIRELLVQRGCDEIVVSEVRGSYSGICRARCYRGTEYLEDTESIKLETVVEDGEAMTIVEAILHASHESSDTAYQNKFLPTRTGYLGRYCEGRAICPVSSWVKFEN